MPSPLYSCCRARLSCSNSAWGAGNHLTATDSAAISYHAETLEERVDHYLADPDYRGAQLTWTATAPAEVTQTSLGATFEVVGQMSDRDPRQPDCALLPPFAQDRNHLPPFDSSRPASGTFFDDDFKLLVSWPLALDGKIYHDIPFGVIQEREDCPFFPVSWTDYSDGENGIAFIHQGTPNHWVHQRTVVNLLGWGEDTDAIHNGLGRYQWPKSFDQRLDGEHTINLAVMPHPGDWRTAAIPQAAQEYGMPPVAFQTDLHTGDLPSSLTLLRLTDPDCVATSIHSNAERLVCRLYSTGEKTISPEFPHPRNSTGSLALDAGRIGAGVKPVSNWRAALHQNSPKKGVRMKPKLILIGGEAWTGKSTCAGILYMRLSNSAWLDGDDVWRVNPWSLDDPRLRTSDINMAFVVQTYLQSNFDYVILSSIVLSVPAITTRILERIHGADYDVLSFTLMCDEATLDERAG